VSAARRERIPATSRALHPFDAEQFPQQLQELLTLSRRGFPPGHPFATVRVVPEGVPLPPIWVLASSGATAAFAGSMGFGYGFARHFSPAPPGPAIDAYRTALRRRSSSRHHTSSSVWPSSARRQTKRPTILPPPATSSGCAGIAVTCGHFLNPEDASKYEFRPEDRPLVEANRQRQFVGSPDRIVSMLRQIAAETAADELMVTTMVYGKAERLRSYELLAEAWGNC
jgi:alkanesulfonate monooxygenase SsuD/methylene tetrahydromethanopterin reductase-like flavin-dependent oxidoreductase (luciferase family)